MTRIVFVHRGPHRLHLNWARSIGAKLHFFHPKMFSKPLADGRSLPKVKGTILTQLLALFSAFTLPKADIYLVEGASCILPTIFRRGKVIMINSDPFFQILEKKNFLLKRIYLSYLKRVDAMISTSDMIRRMAQEYTNVPNKIVYPYCEDKYFKTKAKIDGTNICTSGRLSAAKGTDLLIREFEKNPKGKLYLFGSLEGIKVSSANIICTGWVDDLQVHMSKCSLYVSNSRFDAFGVGILEAMAEGMPVLVSRNCGIAEILPKELTFSDEEFSSKFKKARDLKFQRKYGPVCRRIALSHTKKKSLAEFSSVFEKLMRELR